MADSWFDFFLTGGNEPTSSLNMEDVEATNWHTLEELLAEELRVMGQDNTAEDPEESNTPAAHQQALSTTTITGSQMSRIPNELLSQIAKHLPRGDLLNFALTSKRLEKASIPVIYGTVDLSIHNRGRVGPGPYGHSDRHSHYSSSFRCINVPPRAFTRQEKFIEQVMQHPEYATYVQSLTWTLLLLKEPEWANQDKIYPLLGFTDRPIRHIWEVFEKLANVKTLDLAYLSQDHSHPLASAYPDALFPRASSVRLSGVMDYALAASILASKPEKLKHLYWENVQQPLKRDSLFERTIQRQPYQQQTPAPWNNLIPFNGDSNAYFEGPGPMHNLLGSLAGRCSNLVSLELHKTAERGPLHTRERSELPSDYSSQDEDTYHEWAHFLQSQKHTLKRILWQQGQFDFSLRTRRRRGAPGTPLMPRMDERFIRIIWPIIMYEEDDWPCLQELQIKGVYDWGEDVWEEDIKDALWAKFDDELMLWVNQKADVLDHNGMFVNG